MTHSAHTRSRWIPCDRDCGCNSVAPDHFQAARIPDAAIGNLRSLYRNRSGRHFFCPLRFSDHDHSATGTGRVANHFAQAVLLSAHASNHARVLCVRSDRGGYGFLESPHNSWNRPLGGNTARAPFGSPVRRELLFSGSVAVWAPMVFVGGRTVLFDLARGVTAVSGPLAPLSSFDPPCYRAADSDRLPARRTLLRLLPAL
jgi:hypothetical protein